jgi:hypothetical protein
MDETRVLKLSARKLLVKKVKPESRGRTPWCGAPSMLRERKSKPMQQSTKLIFLAGLGAATLLAQRPFGVLTSSTPPSPATIVQNQVAALTSLLSLTSAQQSDATTIFTNALNSITPLETTIKTDYQSLATAVKSNDTSTIDQLSSALGSLNGQIIDIQNKADAAFYAILTSSQQTTLGNTPFPGGPGFGFGFGIMVGPGPGGPPSISTSSN